MASDKARNTFDKTRHYRSVVMQQGRVTLEADVNEAQVIGQEALREETIDIVGPCGTPDEGYAIAAVSSGSGPFDFSVGPGTMYVGGLRVELPGPPPITYATQTEWLDRAGDPLWVDPNKLPDSNRAKELVWLLLREQEVGAVEDTPLRDVALGGPDTAQRTRLVQRIVRTAFVGEDCAAGLAEIEKMGLHFGPKDMGLGFPATLQVGFAEQPPAESPCEPAAPSGYLGADNQLVRVQITAFDAATKKGRFAWGFNNASFLYRAKAADAKTLELSSSPIDDYHAPLAGRAIEVLRSAIDLGHGDYVAAQTGVVFTLSQSYQPGTPPRLALPAPLDDNYRHHGLSPLFVRLWEQELDFAAGVSRELPGTGLTVTVDWQGGAGPLTLGQFWTFAVRPSTPVDIYPQRYYDAPQPPEGPRLWACPLAVLAWPNHALQVLRDCREKFDNLVELTKRKACGCCTVVLKPADVAAAGGLQAILDRYANTRTTISLQAGLYELDESLHFGHGHSLLTLEGCQDGAVLAAKAGKEANFRQGLVVLERANDVSLRRLRFHLPLVPTVRKEPSAVSIAVRPVHCANLKIEACLFRFMLFPNADTTAFGILAGSECWNFRLERNRFLHDEEYLDETQHQRILIGYALMPQATGRGMVLSLLENAVIADNEFHGLSAGVYVRADYGHVRCENNRVRNCGSGFHFTGLDLSGLGQLVAHSYRSNFTRFVEVSFHEALLDAIQASTLSALFDLGLTIHLPKTYVEESAIKLGAQHADAAHNALLNTQSETTYRRFLASLQSQVPNIEAVTTPTLNHTLLTALTKSLSLPKFVAIAPARRLSPTIHFNGNDIELRDVPATGESLSNRFELGLLVLLPPDEQSSVIVIGNRIRVNNPHSAAVSIAQPTHCVVSANLLLNSARRLTDSPAQYRHIFNPPRSLILFANPDQSLVAVSGNGFEGTPLIIPLRATSAQTDSWEFLNSVA